MDLPINDEELLTVVAALKLGGDTALHNKLKLVTELRALGKPYKKILRDSTVMSCKYDEVATLQTLKDYITGTYQGHYSAGNDQIQTLDLIEACGDAEAFCRSNILKCLSL